MSAGREALLINLQPSLYNKGNSDWQVKITHFFILVAFERFRPIDI
jgi:hypothetical protein